MIPEYYACIHLSFRSDELDEEFSVLLRESRRALAYQTADTMSKAKKENRDPEKFLKEAQARLADEKSKEENSSDDDK